MFEELKQQRLRGMSPKERTRLVTMVSLTLVLGAVVFTYRSCDDATMRQPEIPASEVLVPPARRTVDRAPLSPLLEAGGSALDLHRPSLDHLLAVVRSGTVDLATRRRTPAEANALVPAEAAGTPIEVEGVVESLDSEPFSSDANPAVDLLWSFALEGEDGARVVVLHGGTSHLPGQGSPRDAYLVGGVSVTPIAEGDRVVARGIYLQKKTGGAVGALAIGTPTAVVVGSEFRRVPDGPQRPPPGSLDDLDWESVNDRHITGSKDRIERDVHFQAIAWAQARGREAILADLRSGAIPTRIYDREAYLRWVEDLEADRDREAPDPRAWTNAARGKVFVHSGRLATVDEESWATVAPNAYGVDTRWNLWIVSDHHHSFGALRFHSPFSPTSFPGITGRKDQRVILYGVFVGNYTYDLDRGPTSKEPPEVTVPYFVVLHMEPWGDLPRINRWENVFWYAGLALLTLGALFYVVLIRGERKESAATERHRIALRQRQRASAGGPTPPARKGDAPAGGGGPAGPGT